MERAVCLAAGDPALRQSRRRPLRPATRHPVRHPRDGGAVRPRDASVGRPHRPRRPGVRAPLRHGHRLPVHRTPARFPRHRALHWQDLSHWPLAARGSRLHRSARRRDRHGFVGDPGGAGDRAAGGTALRVPAHAELQHPIAQRPDDRSLRAVVEVRVSRAARAGAAHAHRHPEQPERHLRAGDFRTGAAAHLRGALGGRRHQLHGGVQRSDPGSRGERHGGRVRARQDPRDGAPTARRRNCWPRRTIRSAPSASVSIPTTTAPSTARTSR